MKGIMGEADKFYRDYYPPLYKYLCALTGDPVLSEDIAEDVFMKALTSPEKYSGVSSVLAWLCTVGKNRFYNITRRADRKNIPIDDVPEISAENNIYRDIEAKETYEYLSEVIRNMNEPEKDVFLLRAYAGLSFAEIAAKSGRTEVWARTVYYRTKNRLAAKLKEDDYEL